MHAYVMLSLSLLFISQAAIFVFAYPGWGINSGHDPINDFHMASVIQESSHFQLGQVGYVTIKSYTYYPLLHLLSTSVSKVAGIPLSSVAKYVPSILNAFLVPIALFYFNQDFFGLKGRYRNIATLLFATNWYYTSFQSSFVRESFAFPFALLALLMAARILKYPSRKCSALFFIFLVTVQMSHHVSSYVLLAILAIITFSFRIFRKNNNLVVVLVLATIIHFIYTSYVVFDFAIVQAAYAVEGLSTLFLGTTQLSVLKHHEYWRKMLAYSYYLIIGLFTLAGMMYLWRRKKRINWEVVSLALFFVVSFYGAVLLRLSTPAHAWSWTYYMSLRWTIWASIGISFVAVLGIKCFSKLSFVSSSTVAIAMILVFSVLAAGKFSQYSPIVSDPEITPDLTYPRYMASLWLKEEATHGSNLLVAAYSSDPEAFQASRSMAPYAYLQEFFPEGRSFDVFKGYIPFIDEYFDNYRNESGVQIIYSNGEVEIGYTAR